MFGFGVQSLVLWLHDCKDMGTTIVSWNQNLSTAALEPNQQWLLQCHFHICFKLDLYMLKCEPHIHMYGSIFISNICQLLHGVYIQAILCNVKDNTEYNNNTMDAFDK
jgi:hypothetical protein